MPSADEQIAAEVFWKLHEGLSKQAPGSDASTRRALALTQPLPPEPRILDLGCGPGRQSLVLARETGGFVTAVDLHSPFLDQLEARAADQKLGDRIETACESMDALPYADESYDLLWSEGAIYNIGFERGLRAWRRLLRPRGHAAVSELSWLTQSPPELIRNFWSTDYPAMQTREENERLVEQAGYSLLDSFVLPENDWWEDYYAPIADRVRALRSERNDDAWLAALDAADEEEAIFRACAGSFGYVFFVIQKDV